MSKKFYPSEKELEELVKRILNDELAKLSGLAGSTVTGSDYPKTVRAGETFTIKSPPIVTGDRDPEKAKPVDPEATYEQNRLAADFEHFYKAKNPAGNMAFDNLIHFEAADWLLAIQRNERPIARFTIKVEKVDEIAASIENILFARGISYGDRASINETIKAELKKWLERAGESRETEPRI